MAHEMQTNYENYKTVNYSIVDDTFNERTDKIVNLIKARDAAKVDATFVSYIRIDLVERYPEQMKLLKELNLKGMFFGIETFSHEAGKIIGKGLHPDRTKEILYQFKEIFPNSSFTGGFMTGLPGETIQSFMQTVKWLEKDDCPIDTVSVTGLNLYDTSADQNSLFTQNPEKYGIYKTKEHFYINENWTYSVAHKIANTVDKSLAKKSKKLGGWVSLGLCNLGYTFDEVISPGFIRQPGKTEEIYNRFNEFRDGYIQKICC